MTSPFDSKNRVATLLDRLALRLLLLLLCVLFFYRLWRQSTLSLLAGAALFALVLLTLALFERRTLSVRDRLLRERIGGAIALEELLLMPARCAGETVCALLSDVLGAKRLEGSSM